MRTISTALCLALIAAANAYGQCDPENNPSTCTFGEAYKFYVIALNTEKEVKAANRAETPPDAFAGKVHNSYQDFLNLFAFAINKVDESDDGQALTVRFNPLRTGANIFGATLTAAKPSVSDLVKNALPDDGTRTEIVTKLDAELGDLDDLTYAISFARQTEQCTIDRGHCWGRAPETYRALLSPVFALMLGTVTDSEVAVPFDLKERIVDAAKPAAIQAAGGDAFKIKLDTGATDVRQAREALKALAEAQHSATIANAKVFAELKLDDLAALIDNQPQLTSSLTYHDAGRYGGPTATAATFELQFGNANLNAILSKCKADRTCFTDEVRTRLAEGISTLKWVITASYVRHNAYELADLGDIKLGDQPITFTPIDRPLTNELSVKAQGGWQMSTRVNEKRMRNDTSVEFERITGDPENRKNRFVAKTTITVPLGNNMSIPVTLTWANKEKFLGDQTDKFGAHIGVTYRLSELPSLFGKK